MKILCFIDSLGSGGAQRQMVELAKGFKERGYEVEFLTYHPINFFKYELDSYNISLKVINTSSYLKRILKVKAEINKYDPSIVIAFLEAPSFIATILGLPFRKWKLIVGERSADPEIHKNIKLRIYRWFHIFADFVVANSNSNISIVKKVNPFLSGKKCRVIYNIVNVKDVEAQGVFSRKTEKTTITVAGSFRKVKNIDGLISAISLLSQDYKSKLEICWYGEEKEDGIVKEATDNIIKYGLEDVIKLKPATTKIFDIFLQSDFVALFSHYEGFPNTICEAMALGKPVVVTNVSDIAYIIQEGVNGYLCDSHDIVSIRNAIIKAIDSNDFTRNNMKMNNIEIAQRKFNKAAVVEEYLNLFI